MSSWASEYEAGKSGSSKSKGNSSYASRRTYDDDGDATMAGPSSKSISSTLRGDEDQEEEELEPETKLEQLMRHWMNERHAPDLLPRQEILLSSLLDHIHRQKL
jgi:hypothetical protein